MKYELGNNISRRTQRVIHFAKYIALIETGMFVHFCRADGVLRARHRPFDADALGAI